MTEIQIVFTVKHKGQNNKVQCVHSLDYAKYFKMQNIFLFGLTFYVNNYGHTLISCVYNIAFAECLCEGGGRVRVDPKTGLFLESF